jgi:hypothetical protein
MLDIYASPEVSTKADQAHSGRSMEEALATFRRLGNGFWLHDALLAVSDRWLNRGDLHRAQASLTEARDEWHRAGGEPRWRDLARAGYLQLMQGDVAGGRRSLGEANQMAGRNGEWGPSYLEAAILREEDRDGLGRIDQARVPHARDPPELAFDRLSKPPAFSSLTTSMAQTLQPGKG